MSYTWICENLQMRLALCDIALRNVNASIKIRSVSNYICIVIIIIVSQHRDRNNNEKRRQLHKWKMSNLQTDRQSNETLLTWITSAIIVNVWYLGFNRFIHLLLLFLPLENRLCLFAFGNQLFGKNDWTQFFFTCLCNIKNIN